MPNPSQIPKSHIAAAPFPLQIPKSPSLPSQSLPSPSNRTTAASLPSLPSLSVKSHNRCPPFPLCRIAQRLARCPPFPLRRIAQPLASLPCPSNRTAATLPSLSVESHSRWPPFLLRRIAQLLPSLPSLSNRTAAGPLPSLPSPSNRIAAALPSLSVESHSRWPSLPSPSNRTAPLPSLPSPPNRTAPLPAALPSLSKFPNRRIAQRRCPPSHPLAVWHSGRSSSSAVCVSSIVYVSDSPPCSGRRLRLSVLFRSGALRLTEDRALVFIPSPTRRSSGALQDPSLRRLHCCLCNCNNLLVIVSGR